MTKELTSYLRLQALICAAFNFFIGGFIAALIYHRADFVPTDAVSISIDITITCLLTFLITAPFCRSSLRRDKTGGLLDAENLATRFLSGLSRRPVAMCLLFGTITALILSALVVPLFLILRVSTVPFYLYIALKCLFCAAMGAYVTVTVLFAGMLKTE
ncbi:MAG: hypothetical protein PHP22_08910 [Oscillospiraceae bacterium]|jgi:small-conductance mechanosensitive channel|nr:hypothetical protein [Oscillospiraceae bacterium]